MEEGMIPRPSGDGFGMSLLEALKRVREMHIPMARNAYYTLTTNDDGSDMICACVQGQIAIGLGAIDRENITLGVRQAAARDLMKFRPPTTALWAMSRRDLRLSCPVAGCGMGFRGLDTTLIHLNDVHKWEIDAFIAWFEELGL